MVFVDFQCDANFFRFVFLALFNSILALDLVLYAQDLNSHTMPFNFYKKFSCLNLITSSLYNFFFGHMPSLFFTPRTNGAPERDGANCSKRNRKKREENLSVLSNCNFFSFAIRCVLDIYILTKISRNLFTFFCTKATTISMKIYLLDNLTCLRFLKVGFYKKTLAFLMRKTVLNFMIIWSPDLHENDNSHTQCIHNRSDFVFFVVFMQTHHFCHVTFDFGELNVLPLGGGTVPWECIANHIVMYSMKLALSTFHSLQYDSVEFNLCNRNLISLKIIFFCSRNP